MNFKVKCFIAALLSVLGLTASGYILAVSDTKKYFDIKGDKDAI